MRNDIPIGTLVATGKDGDSIGIVVDTHHIRAWPSESSSKEKYNIIYKVSMINTNLYRYFYSYEMVILSE